MRRPDDAAFLESVEGYTAEQLALDARHFFEAGNLPLARQFARVAKQRARRDERELLEDVEWILAETREART